MQVATRRSGGKQRQSLAIDHLAYLAGLGSPRDCKIPLVWFFHSRVTRMAWLGLIAGVLLCGIQSAEPRRIPDEEIDALVRDALAAWQVPGVAVAIVRDGKV